MQCGFLRSAVFLLHTPAPTPYSAVFLLHAPVPAPIKIGCGLVQCGFGAVLAILSFMSVKFTPLVPVLPLPGRRGNLIDLLDGAMG